MAARPPKPVAQAVREHAPWMPPRWEEEDVGALQALVRGEAQPHQQQRAMKFLIEKVCDTYGLGWHPTGPHEASFAAGRRFAGLSIVTLLNLNLSKLRRATNG